MKKSKFTENSWSGSSKRSRPVQRSARPVASTGSASRHYYVRKSKYAGMEVSQLRHLEDVEAELARMKRMYAELALDQHTLKDVLSRKG
ncbi:hypothetical protein ABFO19_06965 [Xanthomonas citri pv. glycines]|uniref:hypothetical protein n=1 Tax=Xanthomonas TaxID=338 RepID=UPI000A7854DE|nr:MULTISPECIES: hypothetical protein [Xanthomonas]QDR44527.1 hypothetical protein FPK90_07335 [Xanthomonas citri pv. glycines]QDS06714.1 hypothetical protein FPL00_07360 [Xanthomonas citri pv. glycines]QDS10993.1 hypothetical protein FPL03_07310 [Xanthomonas citri pv. glycines]QDS19663.1 hypothetical protein FPL05_07730 [Xanthomonas citri pv. glycines]QTK35927.1 hypothetical protein XcgCFBP2526_06925 [Xanthomonas citri pv. glycines CFBP 2526]